MNHDDKRLLLRHLERQRRDYARVRASCGHDTCGLDAALKDIEFIMTKLKEQPANDT